MATELEVILGPPASATSGESNTNSNAGTGQGLVLPKVGVNTPIKSVKATGQATVSGDADSITIAVPKTAPLAHELTHEDGGSDPITGAGLECTITPTPTNYTPTANTIKGQFGGVDNALGTKEPKASPQIEVNSTPQAITTASASTTQNIYGVGALCIYDVTVGCLNVGQKFAGNIGDADGVDFVPGAGANVFGVITGSTTIGDTVMIERIPDNSFGLIGEVYKII